jgi:DNA repair protein RadC
MNQQVLLQKLLLRRESVAVSGYDPSKKYLDSESIVGLVRQITSGEVQEVVLAFFFDPRDRLLGYIELARGGMDWVNWDSRLMFSAALLCGARRIIMSHNHPSGIAKPSRADVVGMKKIIPAANLLGLQVADHIVVAEQQYVSMEDFGLLPPTRDIIREDEKKREEALDLTALYPKEEP